MNQNDFELLLNDFVQVDYDLRCLHYCLTALEQNRAAECEMSIRLTNVVLRDCIKRMDSATDRLDRSILQLCKKGSL